MKMKSAEKEILLQNIRNLPDKTGREDEACSDEENKLLQNAASAAFNSPNPNFVVLDKDTLENFNLNRDIPDDATQDLINKSNSKEAREKAAEAAESEA